MNRNLLISPWFHFPLIIAFVSLGFFSVPLLAHHGTVEYQNKSITLNGTVTDFDFTNPHILVHIDAPGADGIVQHWTVETSPPSLAIHAGWSKTMMKRGDMISYQIHPAKNGSMIGRGGTKVIINGKAVGE